MARLGSRADGAGPRRRAALDEAASTSTPGGRDEYYLDLGAVAFAQEVERAGATCTLELFDGAHGGLTYRYPGAIRALVEALAP